MSSRITIIPDGRLTALREVIDQRLRQAGDAVCSEGFRDFLDVQMRAVFCECTKHIGADEGTVWLLDEARQSLVARFNNGPKAAEFVDSYAQKLSSGLISAVAQMEQPMCENRMQENRMHDRSLPQRLGMPTHAMVAVPFYFAGELRGVLSAVQIAARPAETAGFAPEALAALQMAGNILAGLIERRLLADILGMEATT